MMLRLRVALADRPGALADLTRCIAAAGGDIAQLAVMQRTDGEAVDDLWIGVADNGAVDRIVNALGGLTGAELLGLRRDASPVEFDAQMDFLAYLFAAPQRGAEAFVEMVPAVVDADWAAITTAAGTVLYDSGEPFGERAAAWGSGADAVAEVPLSAGMRLVVGRQASMPWHGAELRRITGVLELGALLVRHCEPSPRFPVTPLTGLLASESLFSIA